MRIADQIVSENVSIERTIQTMKDIVLENALNESFKFWCFRTFTNTTYTHDLYRKVWEYVQNNFKYEDDPVDEQITAPKWLIEIKKGDCDDFATFIKTVLKVFGIESDFLVCGRERENYSHVVVRTHDGVVLDGTNDKFNCLNPQYVFCKVV